MRSIFSSGSTILISSIKFKSRNDDFLGIDSDVIKETKMDDNNTNNIDIAKYTKPEIQTKKTIRNRIHPLWHFFIDYCEALGYGEILKLKIHDGLPALAEEVRFRTSFLNLRKGGQDKDVRSNEKRSPGLQMIKNFENLGVKTLKQFHPEFLHDWEKKVMEREVINLFIENHFVGEHASLKDFIYNLEKKILKRVLTKVNGNQREASKLLNIKSTTLNAKLQRYNISFTKDFK